MPNPPTQSQDARWMRRALSEARKGIGLTSPNPVVGAVLVRDGREVGAGWHRQAGGPHAEVEALAAAGERAQGASLYVTLEPCSTHGRTPPCTQAVAKAGVQRVVVGCLDPNPVHAGKGFDLLREHGIEVIRAEPEVENECREVNEAFFHWIVTGRPFVLLKMAMTLDGRIATAAGESRWITSAAARSRVQELRRWADAILVGAETVRRDNPSLTVREPPEWPRQPRRLIWCRSPDALNPQGKVFCGEQGKQTRCVTASTPGQWGRCLEELGREEVTALLVEGGGELAVSLLQAGMVQKLVWFVAPKLLGGRGSRPVLGGPDPERLADAIALRNWTWTPVGPDMMVTARVGNDALA